MTAARITWTRRADGVDYYEGRPGDYSIHHLDESREYDVRHREPNEWLSVWIGREDSLTAAQALAERHAAGGSQ